MTPSDSEDASSDEQRSELQQQTTQPGATPPAPAADADVVATAREKTARNLVIAWKTQMYYVPQDAVISLPKAPFPIEDGQALGSLLGTKCADRWVDVCRPEHLLQLKGREGTACYTTFSVKDHPSEARFIRLVAGPIAAKNFPKALEAIEADPQSAPPQNDRQKKRLAVLSWKPTECSAPQLDPKYNDWQPCLEEGLKSCAVLGPRPPKRAAPGGDVGVEGDGVPGVKFIKSICVSDTLGYAVHQRPNAVVIVQFEGDGAAATAIMNNDTAATTEV